MQIGFYIRTTEWEKGRVKREREREREREIERERTMVTKVSGGRDLFIFFSPLIFIPSYQTLHPGESHTNLHISAFLCYC